MFFAVLFIIGINTLKPSPAAAGDYDTTEVWFFCDANRTVATFNDGTGAALFQQLASISDLDCSAIKTPIKCNGNTVSSWSFGNDTGILEEDLCDYIKNTMEAGGAYSLYAEEGESETCSAGQMMVDGACIEPEFTITTTDMAEGTVFEFSISAAGTFYVDWGDGTPVQIIDKPNTGNISYAHTYDNGGVHTIKMAGDATRYNGYTAAIFFSGNTNIKTVDGSLGAIFGGNTPYMFYYTFSGCTSLQSIPAGLFSGVTGSADSMFTNTFADCTSLQSIPAGLFNGVTGSDMYMFYSTFENCTSLASLPDGLFKNIEGKPAIYMFYKTFNNCTNLSGYIPADTFAKMDSTDFNSETMGSIFADTALDTSCPAGTHQYITGFESAWNGKVACVPCPSGTTSAAGASDISHCVGGRTLHIGDDITMNLTTSRPTTPRVMVFQVLDELYYGGLSDTEKTINKNTDKKFRIFFDNKDYWLHDYTVE